MTLCLRRKLTAKSKKNHTLDIHSYSICQFNIFLYHLSAVCMSSLSNSRSLSISLQREGLARIFSDPLICKLLKELSQTPVNVLWKVNHKKTLLHTCELTIKLQLSLTLFVLSLHIFFSSNFARI